MNMTRARLPLLLIVAACLAWPNVASSQALPPRGSFVPLKPDAPVGLADLVPPLLEDENYNDKYTFQYELDGGGEVYFSVFITNLGPGQGKVRLRSRVVQPDGTRLTDESDLDRDEWKSAPGKLDLEMGRYHLSGTPERLALAVKAKAYSFELVSVPDVEPWRPPQGTLQFKKKGAYFHTVYDTPRCLVSGAITANGQAREVKGVGYGIHSHSNSGPYELATRWISFRSVDRQWTAILRQVLTSREDGRRTLGWLVVAGPNGERFSSKDLELTLSDLRTDPHPNQYQVPNKVVVNATSGDDQAFLLFKAGEQRSRNEPLKSLNALARMVAERLTQPVELEYAAPFVAKVRLNGTWHQFDGVGTYELSFLNK
jgi:hypothetical protein